jgi:1-acyl-sn-glycerol-3-phosphate acyltransferase
METGLPLLPVTVKNSFKILPSDSLDLTPGTVDIIVHRPIYVPAHGMDRLDEIMEDTRRTISSAL